MAKNIFIGDSSNKANIMKSGHIGINDISRSIKSIYIGVNNVAKLVWSKVVDFFSVVENSGIYSSFAVLNSVVTSHEKPGITASKLIRLTDNVYVFGYSMSYRYADSDTSYSYNSKVITVNNDNTITVNYAKGFKSYYLKGNYYYTGTRYNEYSTISSYPIYKSESLESLSNITQTKFFDSSDFYLYNFCKVDDNTFAAYVYKRVNYVDTLYMYIFDENGPISSYTYLRECTEYSTNFYSELFYISDRKLACLISNQILVINISEDYKTRTITRTSISGFNTINGATSTVRSIDFFNCENMILYHRCSTGNDEYFLPFKIQDNNAIKGEVKVITGIDAGITINQLFINNTYIRVAHTTSSFTYKVYTVHYDYEQNKFTDYQISTFKLPSLRSYGWQYGFELTDDDISKVKLMYVDTNITQNTTEYANNKYSFDCRVGYLNLK